MSAVRRHLGRIGGGWRAAWTGWPDNPLWQAWERGNAQREERVAWWKRSPGLSVFGAVLSLGVTAANVWLVVDSLHYFGVGGGRPNISANLSLGVGITLAAGWLFCLVWLGARLYRALQFALGFLEHQPRQTFRQSLDDMLAVSSLSEQEILIGSAWFGLRQVAWPLVGACACASVFAGRLLAAQAANAGTLASAGNAAELTLGLFAMLCVSGLLAALALILLGIALSLTTRSGVLPAVGAAGVVFMQLPYLAAGLAFAAYQLDAAGGQTWLEQAGYGLAAGALFLLLLFLLFYLARRINAIRSALAAALLLVLALPYGLFAATLAINLGDEYSSTLPLAMPLELLTLLNPSLLLAFFTSGDTGEKLRLAMLPHWAGSVALQLALVWIAAELARDAVRRRKWGEAG
jgi:hypothetical protein